MSVSNNLHHNLGIEGAARKETLIKRVIITLKRQIKRHFRRTILKIKDTKLKMRYLIILHMAEGHRRRTITKMLFRSISTVDRIHKRFVVLSTWRQD